MKKRYSRQEELFGASGQEKLDRLSVAVVGLGGLGSHVVQQLSYLGIRKYILVDQDHIEESNLNRLIGAIPMHVGKPKLEVAKRLIRSIQPEAQVDSKAHPIQDDSSQSAVGQADFVFGCVDNDQARLVLLEFSAESGLPYLDLATDTDNTAGKGACYGGRLVLSGAGKAACLSCLDLLDQHEMALNEMADDEVQNLYGIDRNALGTGGPSVVSLNGVVASLAVTEFMVWATGLREPKHHLTYRGEHGVVRRNRDSGKDTCPYCSLWLSRQ